jgi:hypothetical protein
MAPGRTAWTWWRRAGPDGWGVDGDTSGRMVWARLKLAAGQRSALAVRDTIDP